MSHIALNGFDFHGWGYEKIGSFLQAREIEQFELQYEMGNDQPLGSAAPILADYGVTIGCIYTGSRWALAHAEQARAAHRGDQADRLVATRRLGQVPATSCLIFRQPHHRREQRR